MHNSFAIRQFAAESRRILKRHQNLKFSQKRPSQGARPAPRRAFSGSTIVVSAKSPRRDGQKNTIRLIFSQSRRPKRLPGRNQTPIREADTGLGLQSPPFGLEPVCCRRRFRMSFAGGAALELPEVRRLAASGGFATWVGAATWPWKVGRSEGRKVGRSEGRKVGRSEGRKEECPSPTDGQTVFGKIPKSAARVSARAL